MTDFLLFCKCFIIGFGNSIAGMHNIAIAIFLKVFYNYIIKEILILLKNVLNLPKKIYYNDSYDSNNG